MILPSFAVVGEDFGSFDNLIDAPSLNNVTSGTFVMSDGTSVSDVPAWKVELKPSTTYSFISSGGGSDRLLIAPVVNVDGNNIFYEQASINYLYLYNDTKVINGITFSMSSDGSITMNGTSGNTTTVYYLTGFYIPPGEYYYKVFGSRGLNGSNFYSSFSNEQTGAGSGDYGSGRWFTSNGNTYTFAFTIGPNLTMDNTVIYPGVYKEEVSSFSVGYSQSFFIDENISLTSVTTPSVLSGQYILALHDPTASDISDVMFSRITSDSNHFYLIEGEYTYSDVKAQIESDIGSSSYNLGYGEGYRVGESEGLEASKTLVSVVYSVLSAPFVIISNTLNFEILGINIINIVKITLTKLSMLSLIHI